MLSPKIKFCVVNSNLYFKKTRPLVFDLHELGLQMFRYGATEYDVWLGKFPIIQFYPIDEAEKVSE